jgi:NADH:ubiquinone oxidoreductase subunit E
VTLPAEVDKLRKRYPDPTSAVMPALSLAQEENGGWLSPDAIREVADALDMTPAYCLSIASFYDQYYLEPVGRTRVEVCTNVSCALSGAQQVLEAFERELGIAAGATSDDGEFTLGTIECLGGCGWATVVAVDNRHRLRVQADDVPGIVEELRSA